MVARLIGLPDATGIDTFAVWICRVPVDTLEPTWTASSMRLPLTPGDVVARAGDRLATYFSTISHGDYTVELVEGGVIELAAAETSEDCVARALAATTASAAGDSVEAILAVADAEHVATAPGGWGTAGSRAECPTTCPVSATGRAAYVGASDFHPDWGEVPALDLIEHEIGHTLGLPHSGATGGVSEGVYTSALDVMSNSAAPRDVDPARRDAPDTLAIDRVALGWLPLRAIAIADAEAQPSTSESFTLAPSTADEGVRLLVLPVDDHTVATVELLEPTGYDAHLPAAGLAVHVVGDLDRPASDRQQLVVGTAPFTDLLGAGESLDVEGWRIDVVSLSAGRADVSVVRIWR